METWKEIGGYPGYHVSDHGNVIGKYGQVLRAIQDHKGYLAVSLYRDKEHKRAFIARLVALAFIPPVEGKAEVDHIDRNPLNNHVSNLRWANRHEQIMNRTTPLGVSGIRHIRKHGTSWRVDITRHYTHVFLKSYPTREEAIAARDAYLISVGEVVT